MIIKGIINYSHHLLQESVEQGDLVVDATCGNGNDTLFLSELVGSSGHVLAFDIQDEAIENTDQLLIKKNRSNVTLVQESHENVAEHLDKKQIIGGAIFNLGYLPRGDKSIVTKGDSTIKALQTILQHLKVDGIAVLVVYHGHNEGKLEKETLLKHVCNIDQKSFNVLRYGFINQKNNPPFVIAIQKR